MPLQHASWQWRSVLERLKAARIVKRRKRRAPTWWLCPDALGRDQAAQNALTPSPTLSRLRQIRNRKDSK